MEREINLEEYFNEKYQIAFGDKREDGKYRLHKRDLQFDQYGRRAKLGAALYALIGSIHVFPKNSIITQNYDWNSNQNERKYMSKMAEHYSKGSLLNKLFGTIYNQKISGISQLSEKKWENMTETALLQAMLENINFMVSVMVLYLRNNYKNELRQFLSVLADNEEASLQDILEEYLKSEYMDELFEQQEESEVNQLNNLLTNLSNTRVNSSSSSSTRREDSEYVTQDELDSQLRDYITESKFDATLEEFPTEQYVTEKLNLVDEARNRLAEEMKSAQQGLETSFAVEKQRLDQQVQSLEDLKLNIQEIRRQHQAAIIKAEEDRRRLETTTGKAIEEIQNETKGELKKQIDSHQELLNRLKQKLTQDIEVAKTFQENLTANENSIEDLKEAVLNALEQQAPLAQTTGIAVAELRESVAKLTAGLEANIKSLNAVQHNIFKAVDDVKMSITNQNFGIATLLETETKSREKINSYLNALITHTRNHVNETKQAMESLRDERRVQELRLQNMQRQHNQELRKIKDDYQRRALDITQAEMNDNNRDMLKNAINTITSVYGPEIAVPERITRRKRFGVNRGRLGNEFKIIDDPEKRGYDSTINIRNQKRTRCLDAGHQWVPGHCRRRRRRNRELHALPVNYVYDPTAGVDPVANIDVPFP